MTKFIFPHLQLGDNIICNGLIRSLVSPDNYYILITDPIIKDSIQFMYKDLPNLQFWFGRYKQAIEMLNGLRLHRDKLLVIGDLGKGDVPQGLQFDAWFYHQFDLDFSLSFSRFFVDRDYEREARLRETLGINGSSYILIHDDGRFQIQRDLIDIPNDFSTIDISPVHSNNLFDWCTLIESATELHCIESSVMFLADRLLFKSKRRPKLFVHRYARQYPKSNCPTLVNPWIILNSSIRE
jgi:hypothetical protein